MNQKTTGGFTMYHVCKIMLKSKSSLFVVSFFSLLTHFKTQGPSSTKAGNEREGHNTLQPSGAFQSPRGEASDVHLQMNLEMRGKVMMFFTGIKVNLEMKGKSVAICLKGGEIRE
jgi:hypothetical protein